MKENKCTEIEQLLPLYVDKMLTFIDSAEIEAHLKTCEKCSESLKMHEAIINTSRDLKTISVSDSFDETLRAKLNNVIMEKGPSAPPIWQKKAFKTVASFATVAAVIAVSVVSLNSLKAHNKNIASLDSLAAYTTKAPEESNVDELLTENDILSEEGTDALQEDIAAETIAENAAEQELENNQSSKAEQPKPANKKTLAETRKQNDTSKDSVPKVSASKVSTNDLVEQAPAPPIEEPVQEAPVVFSARSVPAPTPHPTPEPTPAPTPAPTTNPLFRFPNVYYVN